MAESVVKIDASMVGSMVRFAIDLGGGTSDREGASNLLREIQDYVSANANPNRLTMSPSFFFNALVT